ncbi:hypothetical protein BASA81_004930 [Batrachochytrium salamandrivorans]|nr:hypothetical protein BASA81_004930 [Batrachochytrium salamandrivorans]
MFVQQLEQAVDKELREGFDALTEHLRQAKKLLQRKERKLGELESECKSVLQSDLNRLEEMIAQGGLFDFEPTKGSGEQRGVDGELGVKLAKAKCELESIRSRRLALEAMVAMASGMVDGPATVACDLSVKEIGVASLDAKRLKRLSDYNTCNN